LLMRPEEEEVKRGAGQYPPNSQVPPRSSPCHGERRIHSSCPRFFDLILRTERWSKTSLTGWGG
jgi:hypothetical protein